MPSTSSMTSPPRTPVKKLARLIAERGESGQSMRVAVSRAGDSPYETSIGLSDYGGETNIVLPFVFHVRNGVHRDRWGIGPWGIVMNNRNNYIANGSTREVETRNIFHALLA